jgi:hypothetical protein
MSKDWKAKSFKSLWEKVNQRIAKIGYGHLCLRKENLKRMV